MKPEYLELAGRKFNRWTLLEFKTRNKEGRVLYLCKCDCGTVKTKVARDILEGKSKSCGCFRKEETIKRNKKCSSFTNRLEKGQSGFNKLFTEYISSAKKRSIEFKLTREEFKKLVVQNCHYCGIPPSLAKTTSPQRMTKMGIKYSSFYYNGLDRINNKKGYTLDNVLPCCRRDNVLRMNQFTVEETKVMVVALEQYRILRDGT